MIVKNSSWKVIFCKQSLRIFLWKLSQKKDVNRILAYNLQVGLAQLFAHGYIHFLSPSQVYQKVTLYYWFACVQEPKCGFCWWERTCTIRQALSRWSEGSASLFPTYTQAYSWVTPAVLVAHTLTPDPHQLLHTPTVSVWVLPFPPRNPVPIVYIHTSPF